MAIRKIIIQLENNRNVFKNLLKEIPEPQYLWRPKPEKWCLLEIVCHLLDEEIYDFRTRVIHALENPEKELVPIDPEGWVKTRNYSSKDYDNTLKLFLNERDASVRWLKQETDADWSRALRHPHLGELSAELFLRNWLAHDYLHIRQILGYKFELLKSSSDIDLSYAGNW
ncbi:DinB family protein [Hyunsoonleella sp. SJ7]|uniref:DinB family protein n=1 Tax=Hyunsoonleella aquatilis TaxID=2762758 RepID=A0A923KLP8_9FLAO|nr:DinB family protein [Hyunsoonleella aquatilis]MBC3758165.1 DinB family protein [Hyunsoonleella aquatilis]